MVFSQVRSDGLTIESKVETFLTDSSTAHFLQSAAEGGAKALTEFYYSAKSYISTKMGHASNTTIAPVNPMRVNHSPATKNDETYDQEDRT